MRTIILTAVLLSGCSTLDRLYDEARWRYDGMETATYTWEVVDDATRCGAHFERGTTWGCAVRVMGSTPQPGAKPVPGSRATSGHCFIFSNAPEEDARRVLTKHGDDLWAHEIRHCLGWRH